jgi:predicted 3-demethylubiquinone-9 3-methyltransferase (glyoxalase superfamily)
MQKIIPHLWFDTQAKQAAEFYVGAFKHIGDSAIDHAITMHGTPSGDADSLSFHLAGFSFMAISAGPYFKTNPSISFMVNFDPAHDPKAAENLETLWKTLSEGGMGLMPLDEYPFSKRYGWIQDKFGVSWQLILTNPGGEDRPLIIPSLLFVNDVCGKTEEATDFYLSVFKNTQRGTTARYPAGMEPDKEGSIMFTDFQLENQWFAAMDSAREHKFNFGEGISLLVNCDTQEEIDYYWEKLSAVPEAEQCGWLKDKYGVSWQIVPSSLQKMLGEGTPEQTQRVTKAFLQMKKFNLAELQQAYNG